MIKYKIIATFKQLNNNNLLSSIINYKQIINLDELVKNVQIYNNYTNLTKKYLIININNNLTNEIIYNIKNSNIKIININIYKLIEIIIFNKYKKIKNLNNNSLLNNIEINSIIYNLVINYYKVNNIEIIENIKEYNVFFIFNNITWKNIKLLFNINDLELIIEKLKNKILNENESNLLEFLLLNDNLNLIIQLINKDKALKYNLFGKLFFYKIHLNENLELVNNIEDIETNKNFNSINFNVEYYLKILEKIKLKLINEKRITKLTKEIEYNNKLILRNSKVRYTLNNSKIIKINNYNNKLKILINKIKYSLKILIDNINNEINILYYIDNNLFNDKGYFKFDTNLKLNNFNALNESIELETLKYLENKNYFNKILDNKNYYDKLNILDNKNYYDNLNKLEYEKDYFKNNNNKY